VRLLEIAEGSWRKSNIILMHDAAPRGPACDSVAARASRRPGSEISARLRRSWLLFRTAVGFRERPCRSPPGACQAYRPVELSVVRSRPERIVSAQLDSGRSNVRGDRLDVESANARQLIDAAGTRHCDRNVLNAIRSTVPSFQPISSTRSSRNALIDFGGSVVHQYPQVPSQSRPGVGDLPQILRERGGAEDWGVVQIRGSDKRGFSLARPR